MNSQLDPIASVVKTYAVIQDGSNIHIGNTVKYKGKTYEVIDIKTVNNRTTVTIEGDHHSLVVPPNVLEPDREVKIESKKMKKTDIKKIIREEILKEIGSNDPVIAAVRASKDARLRGEASYKARLAKRLYGKERERLEQLLEEIYDKLEDMYRERTAIYNEQEAKAGEKGVDWSDDDANKIGEELNKVEDRIEKLLTHRNKIEVKLAY
jgi:hypothetical protein